MRARRDASWLRAKDDANQMKKDMTAAEVAQKAIIAQNAQMLTTAATALDMLSLAQMTRFAMQDLADLSDPTKNKMAEMLSLATSIALIYMRIIYLQRLAGAQQATLLAGLGGAGGVIALGIGAGLLVGAATLAGRTERRGTRIRGMTAYQRYRARTGE